LARAAALLRNHPLLTPLLVVYGLLLVLGGVVELGPVLALVDVILLAAYVALIHFATRGRVHRQPPMQPSSSRGRDIRLAVTVAVVQLTGVMIAWFVIIPDGLPAALRAGLKGAGVPSLIAGNLSAVALTVPLLLLPTLIAVAAFRCSARAVGLTARPRDLLLGVVLAAIGIGLGAGAVLAGNHPGLLWESAPIPVVAATITLQSLVNGIPEELAFRGVIFGRLMPWLGRPGNSLAISTMVFGLFHVPSYVAGGASVWLALAIGFFGALPGLVLDYLFYRTRSIWPGAIWHTSITGVGLMFA
jgi:membrane protease YdiL (CAAX protease family)